MQCVELICVRSKKIGKIMHTHTHTEEARIGYVVRQLPTSTGLSLDVGCFTINQLGYTLDISETRCGPYPIHGPARLVFKWKENVS